MFGRGFLSVSLFVLPEPTPRQGYGPDTTREVKWYCKGFGGGRFFRLVMSREAKPEGGFPTRQVTTEPVTLVDHKTRTHLKCSPFSCHRPRRFHVWVEKRIPEG